MFLVGFSPFNLTVSTRYIGVLMSNGVTDVRLVIAGGRDFNNYDLLATTMSEILSSSSYIKLTVISGMARGADMLGREWALRNYHSVIQMPADWDRYGKSAGYRRNVEMVDAATAVLAFWDGKSRGTKHMIDIAEQRGLPLRVVRY